MLLSRRFAVVGDGLLPGREYRRLPEGGSRWLFWLGSRFRSRRCLREHCRGWLLCLRWRRFGGSRWLLNLHDRCQGKLWRDFGRGRWLICRSRRFRCCLRRRWRRRFCPSDRLLPGLRRRWRLRGGVGLRAVHRWGSFPETGGGRN